MAAGTGRPLSADSGSAKRSVLTDGVAWQGMYPGFMPWLTGIAMLRRGSHL